MSVYMSHLSQEDRDFLIEEANLDFEWAKIEASIELADMENEMNKRAAEIKVLQESGTEDDLVYLFKEADDATATADDGIFTKIAAWFKNFFRSIATFFKSIFSKAETVEETEEITVNDKFIKVKAALDTFTAEVKKIGSNINAGTIAAVGAAAAGIVAIIGGGGKVIKTSIGKLKASLNSARNAEDAVEKAVEDALYQANHTEDAAVKGEAKSILVKLQGFARSIKDVITNIGNAISTALGGAATAVKNTVGGAVDAVKDKAGEIKDNITGKDEHPDRVKYSSRPNEFISPTFTTPNGKVKYKVVVNGNTKKVIHVLDAKGRIVEKPVVQYVMTELTDKVDDAINKTFNDRKNKKEAKRVANASGQNFADMAMAQDKQDAKDREEIKNKADKKTRESIEQQEQLAHMGESTFGVIDYPHGNITYEVSGDTMVINIDEEAADYMESVSIIDSIFGKITSERTDAIIDKQIDELINSL